MRARTFENDPVSGAAITCGLGCLGGVDVEYTAVAGTRIFANSCREQHVWLLKTHSRRLGNPGAAPIGPMRQAVSRAQRERVRTMVFARTLIGDRVFARALIRDTVFARALIRHLRGVARG